MSARSILWNESTDCLQIRGGIDGGYQEQKDWNVGAKDLTGERKQKTKRGFAQKSEAFEWERNFKLKENQSISMSFKSFGDIYLSALEPRIKRNTFLTKKYIIETKIFPYLGKRIMWHAKLELWGRKKIRKWSFGHRRNFRNF